MSRTAARSSWPWSEAPVERFPNELMPNRYERGRPSCHSAAPHFVHLPGRRGQHAATGAIEYSCMHKIVGSDSALVLSCLPGEGVMIRRLLNECLV